MLNELLRNGIAVNYHHNTKNIKNLDKYDLLPQYKIYPSAKKIPIDKKQTRYKSDFVRILFNRQSHRIYDQRGINFSQLGQLLSLSFGFNNMINDEFRFRTYASAGARYPIEVYAIILRSEDMNLGIYHYNIVDNSIELIQSGDFQYEMSTFYANQSLINVPCYIMFSMVFERTMHKYGERGYRFLYLDAGHMGQNLYLVSEFLGLGVVALGGGNDKDDNIDALLRINQSEESFFYGFAVGMPDPKDRHDMLANE